MSRILVKLDQIFYWFSSCSASTYSDSQSFPDGQTVMMVAKVTIVNCNCCWLVSCETSWLCPGRTGSSYHRVGVYTAILRALDHRGEEVFQAWGRGIQWGVLVRSGAQMHTKVGQSSIGLGLSSLYRHDGRGEETEEDIDKAGKLEKKGMWPRKRLCKTKFLTDF